MGKGKDSTENIAIAILCCICFFVLMLISCIAPYRSLFVGFICFILWCVFALGVALWASQSGVKIQIKELWFLEAFICLSFYS